MLQVPVFESVQSCRGQSIQAAAAVPALALVYGVVPPAWIVRVPFLGNVVGNIVALVGDLGSKGIVGLMRKNKVEVIAGFATLQGGGRINVQTAEGVRTVEAKNI